MLRAVRPAPSAAAGPAAPPGDGEARACYGIVVACVSLLLLCALVSAVGVARAFAATGVLVLLLGLAGWLAPTDAFAVALAPELYAGNAGGGGGSARAAPAVRLQVRRCASCGLAAQAIDALPAFAYEPPAADVEDGGEGKPRGGGALCAVCLEDVVAGETVRRLPSCGHLFHVDCIDMWLHAHRTCPLCRRDLSPEKVTAKSSAAAATVSSTDVLPPFKSSEKSLVGMPEAAAAEEEGGDGCSTRLGCYGFMAVNVLMGLYCSIAYAVSATVAGAVAVAVALLLLALAGRLAQTTGGGSAAAAASGRRRRLLSCPCACGLMAPGAGGIGVLPAFAYEPGGGGGGVLCAVCLEDLRGGEMVRRLPACGHLFHEDCVDVWLRVRRTCPLCRRVLPPRKSVAAAAAASAAVLPPV
ncbi:Os06g0534900 [Oryza sativa Japonica Group]|uniref:RING-type E3 ubiquitin transferase n=1 Tax=Oryza sativa subsp. japonica TaxID=39947 RepID=C7J376_ORYSJ|nr:Os06g0534900 [Oryza sativa Japonica Group]|eukprot:NP_001174833.1 Os06g0534900 [Oryza sativa Japonica Group]